MRYSTHPICAALVFIVSFAAGVMTPAFAAGEAEKRVALVIGNSAYIHTQRLVNPGRDARAMSDALSRLGFEVVVALDVTQAEMASRLRGFINRLDGADVSLFYYAGHGLSFEGENYIVPVDATAQDAIDIRFGMHRIRTVTDEMARHARINIVLLDACRDNPLAGALGRSMNGRASAAGLGRGLARIEPVGRQSYVMLATQDGQVALDGTGDHSPFTKALLDHIEVSGLEIAELVRRVRKDVRTATHGQQVPLDIGSMDEAFYFKPGSSGTGTTPTISQPIVEPDRRKVGDASREHEWDRLDKTSAAELEMFISRHAGSPEASYARARLAALVKPQPAPEVVPKPDPKPTLAPPSGDDARAEVRRYIEDAYLREKETYADPTDYYDHGMLTPAEIQADQRRYRSAWPIRDNIAIQSLDVSAPLAGRYGQRFAIALEYTFTDHYKSSTKFGRACETIGLERHLGSMIIVSIKNNDAACVGKPPAWCQAMPSNNATETAICGNPQLMRADKALQSLYDEIVEHLALAANATVARASFEAAQDAWSEKRDACGADARCIDSQYRSRAAVLKKTLAGLQ